MRPGPSPFVLLRHDRARLPLMPKRRITTNQSTSEWPQMPPIPPPPPLMQRLKPLLPMLLWWTIITTLITHRLRIRVSGPEEENAAKAQISVLESLIERERQGENLTNEEIRRELEMVGLREKTHLTADSEERRGWKGGNTVSWGEALFGRRHQRSEEEEEKRANEDWTTVLSEVMREKPQSSSAPAASAQSSMPTGVAKRASNVRMYM